MSTSYFIAAYENGPRQPHQRLVLMALADMFNPDNGSAWPSYATLAKRCGLSSRTAMRCVAELERQGYILRRERRAANGRQQSNEFVVVAEKIGLLPDGSRVTGCHAEPGEGDTLSPSVGCQAVTPGVTGCHGEGDTLSPSRGCHAVTPLTRKGNQERAREGDGMTPGDAAAALEAFDREQVVRVGTMLRHGEAPKHREHVAIAELLRVRDRVRQGR